MHFPSKYRLLKPFIFSLLVLAFNCKEDKGIQRPLPAVEKTVGSLSYATGFEIENFQNYRVLTIKNPWPKADHSYKYALVPQEHAATITLNKDEFDGVLMTPIQKIVVTSTTHIPALELLNETATLVGFPGTDYVSSPKTRQLIEKGHVRELGKNEGINTEVLLELQPQVVVGFGIDGNNRTFETIEKSGIPVIYNGDWVETSPLAKAEWIKFFGALYNKQKAADSIFKSIETSYLNAKEIALSVNSKPSVFSGALNGDIWNLPSRTTSEGQLMKDANLNYLWQDVNGTGSLALSFEAVFTKAKDADIWISPSYYHSLEALKNANEHYTQFMAYKNKSVYSFVNTQGPHGGVTYYEEGFARPDLVLKDLIKIGHPELLQDYQTHFFKPLP